MDKKLMMFADDSRWDRLFEKILRKELNPAVVVELAQPGVRQKIVSMVACGAYSFDPPRVVRIPKGGGEFREIYVLGDLDRAVMAVINDIYTELYSGRIHPCCVSYQKGLGVPKILRSVQKKICGGMKGYKVDLSKYFDSVDRVSVNSLLKSMDTGSAIDRLLFNFYNTDEVIVSGKRVPRYRSLGQGVALSTLLANLLLRGTDEKLNGVCDVYLRYSDDILLLGDRAGEALSVLTHEIEKFGLALNPKKVEVVDASREFTFLGGRLKDGEVYISKKTMSGLKKKIRSVCDRTVREGRRDTQVKAIRELQKWMFEKVDGYSPMEYFFSLCTTSEDIQGLDFYAKDCLKAGFAASHNHTRYSGMTSNEDIAGMGWHSLVHLFHIFNWDRDAFNSKVGAILGGTVSNKVSGTVCADGIPLDRIKKVDLEHGLVLVGGQWCRVERVGRSDFMQRAESLWGTARFFDGATPFVTSPDYSKGMSFGEYMESLRAIRKLELLTVSSHVGLDSCWVKSGMYPELVFFRDWLC